MKYYSITTNEKHGVQVLHDGIKGDTLDGKKIYEKFDDNIIKDLVLDKHAIKTDFLESGDLSLKGLIISSKCHNLLKDFNLHDIQFVDIQNNGLNDYMFMFFNGDLTSKIDYKSSNFKLYELDIIEMEFEEVDFKVPQDRKSIIKLDIDVVSRDIEKRIFPSNGYNFNDDFQLSNYDIFRIGHFDLNYYVSEKVKNILEENKVSGCEFIEQKMLET
ncbi:hypothetical protein [Algibacter sp. 2305UL17-15]|uniref:hypothetical protein n=1 Tax=Algibacter sp. 2305UL17-15 TaxID=3231268 RepID=UPI00345A6C2B